jgi:four helix bundle protein
MGSASELEYLLQHSRDLTYLEEASYQVFQQNLIEIRKMLSTFIIKLKSNQLLAIS